MFVGTKVLYLAMIICGAIGYFIFSEYIVITIADYSTASKRYYSSPIYSTSSSECDPPSSNSSSSNSSSSSSNSSSSSIDPCDVVVIVLTGSVYHNTRIVDIQNTYAKQMCQSDKRKNILFISDIANETIPTESVPCSNGYDASMCCKVINGWRIAVNLYPKAKYYLQVDDDSYLVVPNLMRYLSHFNHEQPVYTGHALYITIDPLTAALANNGQEERHSDKDLIYAVGWFGAISGPAMHKIFRYQLDEVFMSFCNFYFWPDVVVGLVFRSAGVAFNTNTFGFDTGWTYGGVPADIEYRKNLTVATHTFHDTTLMYTFEEFYLSNKTT